MSHNATEFPLQMDHYFGIFPFNMRMLRRFPFSRSAEVYFLSFSFLFFSEDKDEKKKGREIIKKKRKEKRNKQTNKQTTATTSPSLGPSIKKKKNDGRHFFWVCFALGFVSSEMESRWRRPASHRSPCCFIDRITSTNELLPSFYRVSY